MMTKYVFTTHMKRHERADLCMKLFKEMFANRRIADQLTALQKRFAALQKGINKFKLRKEPLYTIEIIEYKGTVCYLIISQSGGMAFIYNSSPIDGAFAEFVSIVDGPSTKTVVYTQHALDRYNERVHKGKYTNHRDIIKRLMVNNPTMANGINNDRTNKTVGRLEE